MDNLSLDAVEEELIFNNVLLQSLDTEAHDYLDERARIEEIISLLEHRANKLKEVHQQNDVSSQIRKRPRENSLDSSSDQSSPLQRLIKSRRQSPSISTSIHGSSNGISRLALQKQLQLEERLRQEAEDAKLAQQLSQYSSPTSSQSSVQKSNNQNMNNNLYQMQFGSNGSYSHSKPKPDFSANSNNLYSSNNPFTSDTFNNTSNIPSMSSQPQISRQNYQNWNQHGNNFGQNYQKSPIASFQSTPTSTFQTSQQLAYRSPKSNARTRFGNPVQLGQSSTFFIKPEQKNLPGFSNEPEDNNEDENAEEEGEGKVKGEEQDDDDNDDDEEEEEGQEEDQAEETFSDSSLEEISAAQFRPNDRSLERPEFIKSNKLEAVHPPLNPLNTNFPRQSLYPGAMIMGSKPMFNRNTQFQNISGNRQSNSWANPTNSGYYRDSNGIFRPVVPTHNSSYLAQSSTPQMGGMGRSLPWNNPTIEPSLLTSRSQFGFMSGIHNASRAANDFLGGAINNLTAGLENESSHSYNSQYDYLYSDPTRTAEEIQTLLENIRPDEDLPEELRKDTPEQMVCTLLPHQKLGLTWMTRQEEGSNKGGILADDMGLGKTIQALSLIVSRPSENVRQKTTLIIAPVALLRQWELEIEEKIKPRYKLKVYRYHGSNIGKKSFTDLSLYDVVLTTFGTLGSQWKKWSHHTQLQKREIGSTIPNLAPNKVPLIDESSNWYRIILDEAQNIKNRNSNAAKGAFMLKANHRLCMTGTPMMNNVTELFSLVHFCRIRPFCVWDSFNSEIGRPLSGNGSGYGRGKAMKKLQGLIKATMLRRTKKSKLDGKPIINLPEREVGEESTPFLDEEETNFYKDLESKSQIIIKRFMDKGVLGKKYTNALVLLLRLRQACCHQDLIVISESIDSMTQLGVPEDEALEMAKTMAPDVVNRIKAENGAFQCPICLDGSENPAIMLPCGHVSCSECFTKLRDAGALSEENTAAMMSCPVCRGEVNPLKTTTYLHFKRIHEPEAITEAEKLRFESKAGNHDESSETAGSETASNSDTKSDEDDDIGSETESLDGFIVPDEFENNDRNDENNDQTTLVTVNKSKAKKNKNKSKSKNKGKSKIDHVTSLAELKRQSQRNKHGRQAYFDRLDHEYRPSAKIQRAMDILAELQEEAPEEKILIFSQFTTLLDILEVPLRRQGVWYTRFDGSMNTRDRAQAVDHFRTNPSVRVMLVSLKAGNAGLNLNVASRVIIMDPFWNPYIEEQAIDRAHRIGQKHRVVVRRIVVPDTVEDRIMALQEKKRELINSALDESTGQQLGRLGTRELAYLFGLGGLPSASGPAGAGAGAQGQRTLTGAGLGAGSSAGNALMLE